MSNDRVLVIDFSKYRERWESVGQGNVDRDDDAADWEDLVEDMDEDPEVAPEWRDRSFEMDLTREVRRQRLQREAKDFLDVEGKEPFEAPEPYEAIDFLTQEFEDIGYKIFDLWPDEGNVLFAAVAKFGKSTIVMNLLRVLCDGGNFLGQFAVDPRNDKSGSILLIDLEMSASRVRREILSQEIHDLSPLRLACLRGEPKKFDITDKTARAYWVKYCKQHNVKTLILDPIAPLLGYLGVEENDNTTVNRFFQQLDEFKKEAGIRDMLVTHHCGHTADWRPRGASRFNDWPDALWLAKLEGDLTEDPVRKMFVRGRDVGETFTRAATLRKEVEEPTCKRLLIDMSTAAPSSSENEVRQGVLAALHAHPDGLRASGGTNRATTLLAELSRRDDAAGDLPDPPSEAKLKSVLDSMVASGELVTREVTWAGPLGMATFYSLNPDAE